MSCGGSHHGNANAAAISDTVKDVNSHLVAREPRASEPADRRLATDLADWRARNTNAIALAASDPASPEAADAARKADEAHRSLIHAIRTASRAPILNTPYGADGDGSLLLYATGRIEHRDADGYLHDDHGPAVTKNNVIEANGGAGDIEVVTSREWHRHGLKHREDGPAVQSETTTYYRDGSVTLSTTTVYMNNGDVHRDDGPAIEITSETLNPDGTTTSHEATRMYVIHGEIQPNPPSPPAT